MRVQTAPAAPLHLWLIWRAVLSLHGSKVSPYRMYRNLSARHQKRIFRLAKSKNTQKRRRNFVLRSPEPPTQQVIACRMSVLNALLESKHVETLTNMNDHKRSIAVALFISSLQLQPFWQSPKKCALSGLRLATAGLSQLTFRSRASSLANLQPSQPCPRCQSSLQDVEGPRHHRNHGSIAPGGF